MAITLLLADDSITIQRVIELTFADEHVRVVAASDGEQAIRAIDAAPPDIVLADVGMPKVDGYAVAAHVKQTPSLKHIPVLLLTGAFEPIDEAKARATGCDGILVKPFKPELLIERVRELLAGQRSAELWPAELPRVERPATPVAQPAPAPQTPPAVRVVPTVAAPPPAPLRVVPPPATPTPTAPRPSPAAGPALVPPPAPKPASGDPSFAESPTSALSSDMLRPASRNPQTAPSRTQLVPRDLPPPADAFESELDMLDVALSRLEPTAPVRVMDAATASEFAGDLAALRSDEPEVTTPAAPASSNGESTATPAFGEWDLPTRPPQGAPGGVERRKRERDPNDEFGILDRYNLTGNEPIDVVPIEVHEPPARVFIAPPAPSAVEVPPSAPVVAAAPVVTQPEPVPPVFVAPPPPPPVVAPMPRPTLANAFSALLAAERAQPPARPLASSNTLSEGAIEEVVKRVLARMADDAVHKVVLDAAERIIREEIDLLKSPPNSHGR